MTLGMQIVLSVCGRMRRVRISYNFANVFCCSVRVVTRLCLTHVVLVFVWGRYWSYYVGHYHSISWLYYVWYRYACYWWYPPRLLFELFMFCQRATHGPFFLLPVSGCPPYVPLSFPLERENLVYCNVPCSISIYIEMPISILSLRVAFDRMALACFLRWLARFLRWLVGGQHLSGPSPLALSSPIGPDLL